MSLTKLLKYVSLGVAVGYSCGVDNSEPETSCSVDTQCKGDRVCVNGSCAGGSGSSGGGNGSGGRSDNFEYAWGVTECDTGFSVNPSDFERDGVSLLHKDFNPNNFHESCQNTTQEKMAAYRCALSKEPNLYLYFDSGRKFCLKGTLVLFTNEPYPGSREECRRIEWSKPWYMDCFESKSLRP